MKKYVFLTPSIGDMGGAQMYVANKIKYLRNCGWEVDVFYSLPFSVLLISELEKFKDNMIIDMQYACHYIPQKRLKKTIDYMASIVGSFDTIIIETQLVGLVGWGELLARELRAKHFVNFLEEKIDFSLSPLADYMEFKLKRREMLNASENILRRGFGSQFKEEFKELTHQQHFVCSNVVDFSDEAPVVLSNADFNILSIGRLDKPYIPTFISEIASFAESHSGKSINLIMIGGSNSGEMEKIIPLTLKKQKNIRVIMLGHTYPIPIGIIKKADVGVASANSILVTAEQGIPTICIDMKDFDSIGIYGYTTINKFHEVSKDKESISSALEDVLINKTYLKNKSLLPEKINPNSIFEKEIEYIESNISSNDYYDVYRMYSIEIRFFSMVKRFVHETFKLYRYKRG